MNTHPLLPQNSTRRGLSQGFSLVELMIAMVLGLLLVAGTMAIFTSSIRNSEFNQSLANIQANARFALGRIASDIRLAGYQGCSGLGTSNLAIRTSPAPTDNFSNTAIVGAVVDSSNWNPGKPDGYTPPTGTGAPVVGTHALMIQYAAGPGAALTSSLMGNGGDISVTATPSINNIAENDLMVISDCSSADLFKVQSVSGTTVKTITPADTLSKAYALQSNTDDTLRVMPFISAMYYIGNTGRTNDNGDSVSSLYMQSFPYDLTNNPPIELVEGVDQMQLLFGVRLADQRVKFVQPDDSAVEPADIESVQIGLLMSSLKRYQIVDPNQIYTVANQPIARVGATTGGTARYPSDTRLRMAFTKAVSVRNRSLGND